MTLDEFFAELSKSRRKWDLRFYEGVKQGAIRSGGAVRNCHCPLTAVATRKARRLVESAADARAVLGLEREDSFAVMYAADGCGDSKIRARLLKACGLDPHA